MKSSTLSYDSHSCPEFCHHLPITNPSQHTTSSLFVPETQSFFNELHLAGTSPSRRNRRTDVSEGWQSSWLPMVTSVWNNEKGDVLWRISEGAWERKIATSMTDSGSSSQCWPTCFERNSTPRPRSRGTNAMRKLELSRVCMPRDIQGVGPYNKPSAEITSRYEQRASFHPKGVILLMSAL